MQWIYHPNSLEEPQCVVEFKKCKKVYKIRYGHYDAYKIIPIENQDIEELENRNEWEEIIKQNLINYFRNFLKETIAQLKENNKELLRVSISTYTVKIFASEDISISPFKFNLSNSNFLIKNKNILSDLATEFGLTFFDLTNYQNWIIETSFHFYNMKVLKVKLSSPYTMSFLYNGKENFSINASNRDNALAIGKLINKFGINYNSEVNHFYQSIPKINYIYINNYSSNWATSSVSKNIVFDDKISSEVNFVLKLRLFDENKLLPIINKNKENYIIVEGVFGTLIIDKTFLFDVGKYKKDYLEINNEKIKAKYNYDLDEEYPYTLIPKDEIDKEMRRQLGSTLYKSFCLISEIE